MIRLMTDMRVMQEYSSLVRGSFYHCGNCKYIWALSNSSLQFLMAITSIVIPANVHLQEEWWGKETQFTCVPRFQVMSAHNAHPTKNSKYVRDVQKHKIYKITYFHFFFFYSEVSLASSHLQVSITIIYDKCNSKHGQQTRAVRCVRRLHQPTQGHTQYNACPHNSHYSHHYSLDNQPTSVCTVLGCWWWTEELSKTCRVLFQK